MDLAKDAYIEWVEYFRRFDPTHQREDEVLKSLDILTYKPDQPYKGDVLMATGLMDYDMPPSTEFAAYNKINSRKEVIIYPDFGHEWLPDIDDIVYRFMCELL